MRIIFFGSSHGVPEANRRCSSTLIEVEKIVTLLTWEHNPSNS